ncbi:hypothetical protein BURMUCF2_B0545 [Burkholderia multivorans CF2]|nr:hypothetical protein BURMUCF2_B0545 [Burkholderia multivorans CF2]
MRCGAAQCVARRVRVRLHARWPKRFPASGTIAAHFGFEYWVRRLRATCRRALASLFPTNPLARRRACSDI